MKTIERAVVAVSVALLIVTIVSVGKAQAAYPAVCEISIKNMVTKEIQKIEGRRTVPSGVDRWDIFDACRQLADDQLIQRTDSRVIQVKAYFL